MCKVILKELFCSALFVDGRRSTEDSLEERERERKKVLAQWIRKKDCEFKHCRVNSKYQLKENRMKGATLKGFPKVDS